MDIKIYPGAVTQQSFKLKYFLRSPQLHLMAKLIRIPLGELVEFLEEKSTENPFLEWQEKLEKDTLGKLLKGERIPPWDENIGNPKIDKEQEERRRYLESLITQPQKLEDILLNQLHTTTTDPQTIKIGEYIIGNLDERGYLLLNNEEIENAFDVNKNKVQEIIDLIQSFYPYGVGARSLKECLLIQIKQKNLGKVEERIIKECFDDFKKTKVKNIGKKLKVTPEAVKKALSRLRKLNPYPASSFAPQDKLTILPEFRITNEGGKISIQRTYFPKIYLNKRYLSLLENGDKETNAYLRKKLKEAKELLEAIKRRDIVLNKVLLFLLNYQKDYLEGGELKDLTLEDVAKECGLDKSSVSKAISDKYIDYEGRIYKLKSLLVHKKAKGRRKSAVEEFLQEMFGKEKEDNPYSDREIEEILKTRGFNLSRRTIAKYRAKLKIPNAYLRKNIKSLKESY